MTKTEKVIILAALTVGLALGWAISAWGPVLFGWPLQ